MVKIKSTENTSRVSDRDLLACIVYVFYNTCDVASS